MKTGNLISVTLSKYFDPILKIISVRITFIVQNSEHTRCQKEHHTHFVRSAFYRWPACRHLLFHPCHTRKRQRSESVRQPREHAVLSLLWKSSCYCTRTVAMYSVPSGTAMPGSAISHVPPAIDIRWHIAIPMSIFCTSHKASCLYPSICFSYR